MRRKGPLLRPYLKETLFIYSQIWTITSQKYGKQVSFFEFILRITFLKEEIC